MTTSVHLKLISRRKRSGAQTICLNGNQFHLYLHINEGFETRSYMVYVSSNFFSVRAVITYRLVKLLITSYRVITSISIPMTTSLISSVTNLNLKEVVERCHMGLVSNILSETKPTLKTNRK